MSNTEIVSIGKPESLIVDVPYLLAALSCMGKSNQEEVFQGVHLVEKDGYLRIFSTDCQRIFMAEVEMAAGERPSWLKKGLTLKGERMATRLRMITKDTMDVQVTYSSGFHRAYLSDTKGIDRYGIDVIDHAYPDLEPAVNSCGFSQEGGADFQPIGFQSKHLKHVKDVADILDSFLDKEQKKERGDEGIKVRCFAGNPERAIAFDFENCPGVLMVVPSVEFTGLSTSTVRMLEPALKATLSALRAHQTRNEIAAQNASNEFTKMEALAKVESYKKRISDLMSKAGMGALTASAEAEAKAKALAEVEARERAEAEAREAAEREARERAEREAAERAEAEAAERAIAEAAAKKKAAEEKAAADKKAAEEAAKKAKGEVKSPGVKAAIGGVKSAIDGEAKPATTKRTAKWKQPNATGRN